MQGPIYVQPCQNVKGSISQDERRSRQSGLENNGVRCILGVNSAPRGSSSSSGSGSGR